MRSEFSREFGSQKSVSSFLAFIIEEGQVMKESNQVRKLLIASAILVLGIPAIASATPLINDEGKPIVRVSYADLNLSSQSGLVALYKRLQGASNAACGPRDRQLAGSLQQSKINRDCYNDLLSKLVAKVGNAKLTEIHAG